MNLLQDTQLTDWFQVGQRLTVPQRVSPVHVEAIGPAARTNCTSCGHTVHARPVFNSPESVGYILPIDEQGRCPSCAWTDA